MRKPRVARGERDLPYSFCERDAHPLARRAGSHNMFEKYSSSWNNQQSGSAKGVSRKPKGAEEV